MKLFIPIKKHHSIQHSSWFTSEIRHCIKRLHTLCCKVRLHPSQSTLANITALETTTQDKISTAKLVTNLVLFTTLLQPIVVKFMITLNLLPNLITCHQQSTSILPATASTDHDKANLFNLYFFTQSSTIHLVYLILMNYLILLDPFKLLSLVLLMYTKLLYHWTLTIPLVLIILGQEYCIAVVKHFMNFFITYSLYHYAMQLYLHAGKFTRWFLYLKLVIPTLS